MMPILTLVHFRRWTSRPALRVPALICLSLCSTPLHGQTRFQQHDTIPAVSRYRSAEECLAAVSRVSDSVALTRPEFPDTLPFRNGEGRDSTVVSAVAIARQCGGKFHPDSVVLTGYVESYADWIRLYLLANRDDAAEVVAQRRIANARQQPKSPQELYDVLTGIMETYGAVRPMRWARVQAIGAQLATPGVAPGPIELYRVYFSQYQLAATVGDTIVQTDMAERMLALAETIPPEIRSTQKFILVRYVNFMLASFLTRTARMDSLRHGPEAYVALSRAHWKKYSENMSLPMPMMIGESAKPVTADFWFTASNAVLSNQTDHPRPSPGHIALVVFLRQGCNARTPSFLGGLDRATFWGPCWTTYASLRRLGQRFPWLEITLVGRTAGYSADTGPMSPQDEALVLQKWWLGFHRLPATLAVTNTQFFRLEGVDRRRVDQPVDNDVNYLFGQESGNEVRTHTAYLIDTNGMVIHSEGLYALSEQTITEMLEAMGQRKK